MKTEDTYIELLRKQYELNNELVQAVKHIGTISESMQQLLAKQNEEIQHQNTALLLNTEVLKSNLEATNKLEKVWTKMVIGLVSAIVVLAAGKEAITSAFK